jgi:hypothetical protein
MRILAIAISAAFLALPVSVPAQACGTSAKATTVDYSAATKKKPTQKKKEKVEYMRAAPMK